MHPRATDPSSQSAEPSPLFLSLWRVMTVEDSGRIRAPSQLEETATKAISRPLGISRCRAPAPRCW